MCQKASDQIQSRASRDYFSAAKAFASTYKALSSIPRMQRGKRKHRKQTGKYKQTYDLMINMLIPVPTCRKAARFFFLPMQQISTECWPPPASLINLDNYEGNSQNCRLTLSDRSVHLLSGMEFATVGFSDQHLIIQCMLEM